MLHTVPKAYITPSGRVYKPFLELAARPHLLIAGATGSGKSVATNGIILSILLTRSPASAGFILIDPKKVELVQYAALPHTVRYASEPAAMIQALQIALDETERRYKAMQAERIREYTGPDLFVIVDELADLMTTQKRDALPLLQRLAQIGRAAKVHLIVCTQNVLAVTIPTVLKCNFSTVLGLRTATRAQSRYLIDSPGCETLPDPKKEGAGYGYLRDGADLTKLLIYKYPESVTASLLSWWTSSACIAS